MKMGIFRSFSAKLTRKPRLPSPSVPDAFSRQQKQTRLQKSRTENCNKTKKFEIAKMENMNFQKTSKERRKRRKKGKIGPSVWRHRSDAVAWRRRKRRRVKKSKKQHLDAQLCVYEQSGKTINKQRQPGDETNDWVGQTMVASGRSDFDAIFTYFFTI